MPTALPLSESQQEQFDSMPDVAREAMVAEMIGKGALTDEEGATILGDDTLTLCPAEGELDYIANVAQRYGWTIDEAVRHLLHASRAFLTSLTAT